MKRRQYAGPSTGHEHYGNPLFQGPNPISPSPMFPGFQANPVWSPAFQPGPSFRTPEPAAERPQLLDLGDTWVEEHFATILENSLTRRGDTVGVLMGLAGALENRANELRYPSCGQALYTGVKQAQHTILARSLDCVDLILRCKQISCPLQRSDFENVVTSNFNTHYCICRTEGI